MDWANLLNMFGSSNWSNPGNAALGPLKQIPGATFPYLQPFLNMNNWTPGVAHNAIGSMLGGNNPSSLYDAMVKNLPTGTLQQLMGSNPQSQYQKLLQSNPQSAFGQLVSNPGQVMNQLGQGFQSSPGYQFEMNQALDAAQRAASAGGMAGSPAHQQTNMELAQGLASKDYNQYMQNAMNMYGQGLAGQTGLYGQGLAGQQGLFNTGLGSLIDLFKTGAAGKQGMYGMGANMLSNMMGLGQQTATDYAKMISDALGSQSKLQYLAQIAQNQQAQQKQSDSSSFWGNLLGGVGNALGGIFF